MGRDAMTPHPFAQGETGNRNVSLGHFFQVTGDSHRGISLSGVGRSAIGSRLQVPAAVIGRDGTASRHSCIG